MDEWLAMINRNFSAFHTLFNALYCQRRFFKKFPDNDNMAKSSHDWLGQVCI